MSANTAAAPPAPPMTAVVPSNRLEPVRPMPVHEVTRAMKEYQDGLAAILFDSDWQTFLDNGGRERRFVKRSGWRKIATWFGLDLLIGAVTIERDERGQPLRARVVGRVVAPNGRAAEDVGACSADERRFSKPEHDLVSTAATRALNRATANLVGMGDVSAEEVLTEIEPLLPDWAQGADDESAREMLGYLTDLYGGERALALANGINNRYGNVPNIAVGLVRAMHRMHKPPPEDMPADEPDPPEWAQPTSTPDQ